MFTYTLGERSRSLYRFYNGYVIKSLTNFIQSKTEVKLKLAAQN